MDAQKDTGAILFAASRGKSRETGRSDRGSHLNENVVSI